MSRPSASVCQAEGEVEGGFGLACTRPLGHAGEHRDDSCRVDWSEVISLTRDGNGERVGNGSS